MRRYASNTHVDTIKSRMDIERLLLKNGALNIATIQRDHLSGIACELQGRMLRFVIATPTIEDYTLTDNNRRRNTNAATKARVKDVQRRWRSLLLVIKARFVEYQDKISVFDQAFMQFIVMPNGKTVAELALPMIERAYETNQMPQNFLLEAPK